MEHGLASFGCLRSLRLSSHDLLNRSCELRIGGQRLAILGAPFAYFGPGLNEGEDEFERQRRFALPYGTIAPPIAPQAAPGAGEDKAARQRAFGLPTFVMMGPGVRIHHQ